MSTKQTTMKHLAGADWKQLENEEESTATCSSCGMPCCAACSYHHGLKVHLCQTCEEKSVNPPLMADTRKPQFNPGIPDESPPDED